ncbi:ATP-dependent RNA helicase DBP10 [Cryptococcus floricola]|uniref:RNA helicase n=1 Tax=Cryptococcus floricola TaxID=2591691 RepID=A0A5D3AVB1_9TREE|nr:ATP-dependent RNA helicase DBP10 [Cryptococcus floricola]
MAAPTPSWALADNQTADPKDKNAGPGAQWRALNVGPDLIRSLLVRKFKSPTPIQRASIPTALSTPPRDILGMARTGSGKTLAYMIPLLQRTGAVHRSQGPRALVLCPSRELAMQIYTVGKDLVRGMSKKGKGKKKVDEDEEMAEDDEAKEALRWAVIIGGEGMDAQFSKMSSEPDIIIATPGRFLHLIVEMKMDLRHLQTVIYDEADRLFEMGFDVQLREILHRLPSTRQNLLFSATLPTSVAEFAKAGLVNPLLVRLDSEQKISEDLSLKFFAVKPTEKEAALLVLLREVLGKPNQPQMSETNASPQAIVFVATKHHVDYVAELLRITGYRTSLIYSSLDQVARQQQLAGFRSHKSDVLVVTDVAARGLDIPIMDHVINYDFPAGARIFIHRVGRTARAGRKGTAYSLVVKEDYPYFCDLHAFIGAERLGEAQYTLRSMPTELLSENVEYVFSSLEEIAPHLSALRGVMKKGQGMFERSRTKANPTSYRASKALSTALSARGGARLDEMFENAMEDEVNEEKARLLKQVAEFTPDWTVFEVGKRESESAIIMQKRRKTVDEKKKRASKAEADQAAASGIERAVKAKERRRAAVLPQLPEKDWKDPSFFLDHTRSGADEEKGYSLKTGADVPTNLNNAVTDFTADEGAGPRAQKASQLSWDRKKHKFIQKSGSAEGVKMIKSESGALLPATYSSGKYKEWQKKRKNVVDGPVDPLSGAVGGQGRKGKHGPVGVKRKDREEGDGEESGPRGKGGRDGDRPGKPGKKGGVKQSSGIRSAEDIRKHRATMAKRKEKNARKPHKFRK